MSKQEAFAKVGASPFHAVSLMMPFRQEVVDALAEDLKNGVDCGPIWVDEDDNILDGRHLYLAHEKNGFKPEPRFEVAPVENRFRWVIRRNLEGRRHLTVKERLIMTDKASAFYALDAKARQLSGKAPSEDDLSAERRQGKAAQLAAEDAKVPVRTVERVHRVMKHKAIGKLYQNSKLSLDQAEKRIKAEEKAERLNKLNDQARQEFADEDFRQFTGTYIKAIRKLTGDRADEWQALAEKHSEKREAIVLVAGVRSALESLAAGIEKSGLLGERD